MPVLKPLSFSVRFTAILISVIALGFLMIIAEEFVIPLVFAVLFSILLLPLAKEFEVKLNMPRGAASGIAVILFIVGLVIILYTIGSQIASLGKDWPLFQQQLLSSLNDLQQWVAVKFNYNIEKQKNYIHNATSGAISSGTAFLGSTLLSVTSLMLFVVLTLIYTFFMLLYRTTLLRFIIALVNERNNQTVNAVVSDIQIVIRKYIFGPAVGNAYCGYALLDLVWHCRD